MKKAAKILSLILVVMTVLTMAACGKKETPAAEPEPAAQEDVKEETPAAEPEPAAQQEVKEETEAAETAAEEPKKEEPKAADIIGTYKGQIDYTDQLSADYEESLGFTLDEPVYMDVYLEMKDDDTFRLYFDGAKFKADITEIITAHVDDIIAKTLEKKGLTMDQLGEVAAQNGYESEGAFREAMIENIEEGLDQSMNQDEMEEELELSGTYLVSGDTIFFATEDGKDTAKINDDGTLTLIIPMDNEDITLIMTK